VGMYWKCTSINCLYYTINAFYKTLLYGGDIVFCLMKGNSILACFLTSILIAGFAFYPLLVGNPQNAEAFNTEYEPTGVTKHVTFIANEVPVQVAPDNALHPGGVTYNAYTFNGTIPGPTVGIDQGDNLTITLVNEG
jgi:nitrite reductase (NO-forming)